MNTASNVARRAGSSLLAVFFIAWLCGCNAGPFGGNTRVSDSGDQPLSTGGRRATMSADVRWDFVRVDQRAWWELSDGGRLSVDEAVRLCESVSQRRRDSDYAGRRFDEGGITHPTTRVIVCVEPLVAVDVPVASVSHNEYDGIMLQGVSSTFRWSAGRVIAPRGYLYGTRVPYHDDVSWLCASLGQSLRPATIDGPDRVIPVTWGELRLIHEGECWKVVGKRTQQ